MGARFLLAVGLLALSAVNAKARTVQVLITGYTYWSICDPEFKFPNAPTVIEEGDTVLWLFQDYVAHTVTSGTRGHPDGLYDSGLIQKGMFQYTFTKAGTYPYYCKPHFGMDSSVTVMAFSPRGDVDGNGTKDMRDVVAAMRLYAGTAAPNDPGVVFANADVAPAGGDGTVDMRDAFAIIRFLNCPGVL